MQQLGRFIFLFLSMGMHFTSHAQTASFNITGLNAQDFLMSSIGLLPGAASNSSTINFKSNSTCIDIKSGIEAFISTQNSGDFVINCAIGQDFNQYGILLYPNPVKTDCKIKFLHKPPLSQLFSFQIWSVDGKLIKKFNDTGYNLYQGSNLNLGHLAAGSYFLQIESIKSLDAIKFIKYN